jgi:hypothetical protein
MQLRAAPDFRRAAKLARHARIVPLALRQRQFAHFRAELVAHLARRLQAGASLTQASAGLSELVAALGLAPFEAEYIISEARQRVTVRQESPSFADAMRASQAAHEERLQAIRGMNDLNDEIREQLLEAEQERFRSAVLGEADRRR